MKPSNTSTNMTREELKGKQTPGEVYVDPDGDVCIRDLAVAVMPSYYGDNMDAANAALYAEAHNVANRTGMWPQDLEQRVKELEEALQWITRHGIPAMAGDDYMSQAYLDGLKDARAILNKKPA